MEELHLSSPQLSMKRGTMYGRLPQDSLVGMSPREKRRVSGEISKVMGTKPVERRRVSSYEGTTTPLEERLMKRSQSEDPVPSYMQGTQATKRKTVGLRHSMTMERNAVSPREPLPVKSYGPPMFLPPLFSQKKTPLQQNDFSKSGKELAEDRAPQAWQTEQIRKCRYVRRKGSIVDPTPVVDIRR